MTLGQFDVLLSGQRKLSGKHREASVQALSMGDWIQRVSGAEAN